MKSIRVFISYSSKDKEFVRKLASDLKGYGIEPWIDINELNIGDSILPKIEEGIKEAICILVILSESSVKSKWVQEEIKAAFSKTIINTENNLIPVVLEGKYEIPSFLRRIKYADFSKLELYQENLVELVKGIRRIAGEEKPTFSELINPKDLAKEIANEVAQILNINPQGIREAEPISEKITSNLVFVVIADFTSNMDPIFDGIQAAGEFHGLQVERIKNVPGDYKITKKIIDMIRKARLIVADLTYDRPNVYFELGFARGLEKTIITTAREGTKLHFDVQDWTCTFYNDSRVLERHLKERFAFELGKT